MTVIIKRPQQTKERNKDFFKRKDQDLTNLDWAKWGGWKDTDGFFQNIYVKATNTLRKAVGLKLKDRQPVELFSEIFETSLTYLEHQTTAPNGTKYTAKEYVAILCGPKAVWFTKNVYPYLIKEEKKDYAIKLLGYRPESKDLTTWTTDEVIHYLGTAIAGDGSFQLLYKTIKLNIYSSDVQYLVDLQSMAEDKLKIMSALSELSVYKTQKGTKTKYVLYIFCSRNRPCNTSFFQSLAKNNIITLDRKKHKVEEFVSGL